jgi:hypothetical protein
MRMPLPKFLLSWLLLSLCAVALTNVATAQEADACRSLCRSEKAQCVKNKGPNAWLTATTLFFRDSLSAWRQRSGTLSDASQWLQQRSDNNTDLKSANQELQQQCENQFMQCALTCTASAVPAAPSSSPQPQ